MPARLRELFANLGLGRVMKCINDGHFSSHSLFRSIYLAPIVAVRTPEDRLIMEMPYYTVLGALVIYSLYRLLRVGHRPKDYPPGPPTLPVLGNIHLVCPASPLLSCPYDSVAILILLLNKTTRWPKKIHISNSKSGRKNTDPSTR